MERFILKKLLDWKNSPYRKPLILKGVRQVGKTWILKEFGRRYYENTAYFNFDENEEYKQFFETTKDVDRILQNLMLASGQKIVPEKTLIIFDEVQDCPKVINSMKYYCENAPQYHVACAGSLLGIALAKPSSFPVGKVNFMQIDPMTFAKPSSFPVGKVNFMQIDPMTFAEFLLGGRRHGMFLPCRKHCPESLEPMSVILQNILTSASSRKSQ